MARGGAFNVARLIEELGLKTISGETMRVLETVQPTMQVGDLTSTTPPHVTPSAFFGFEQTAAVATLATMELQVLSAGGLWIDILIASGTAGHAMFVVPATLMVAPTVHPPAGVTARDAPVSIVRGEDIGAFLGERFPIQITGADSVVLPPIFVPVGQFFVVQSNNVNLTSTFGIGIREVLAAENL